MKIKLEYLNCSRCGKPVVAKMTGIAAIVRNETMHDTKTLCEDCTTIEEQHTIDMRVGKLFQKGDNV